MTALLWIVAYVFAGLLVYILLAAHGKSKPPPTVLPLVVSCWPIFVGAMIYATAWVLVKGRR